MKSNMTIESIPASSPDKPFGLSYSGTPKEIKSALCAIKHNVADQSDALCKPIIDRTFGEVKEWLRHRVALLSSASDLLSNQ